MWGLKRIFSEPLTLQVIGSGWLNGDAILLLDYESASILVNLLSGEPPEPRSLTTSDREALIEIGNILYKCFYRLTRKFTQG